MTFKTTPLRDAIIFALAVGTTAVLGTGVAFAQEATTPSVDPEATTLDRVQVTGSRIRRPDLETASPVIVVERAEIEASGLQNVGDVLRNLSQSDSLGLTNLTNDTNANDGTNTISLRGFGASRTLVLVNGRRWISQGNGVVDTTTIPTALVERVEVLTDGASAIYGSDAIAGVINIILRSDYEGAEASVYYGQNSHGDGGLLTYDALIGASGDRGSVTFGVSKFEQDEIRAGDRAISEFVQFGVPTAFNSSFNLFGRFGVPGRGTLSLDPAREGPGLRTAADFVGYNSAVQGYNFAPTNFLLTPSDRISLFSQASYDLTDNLRFFGLFNYNQRKSVTQIAPVPLTIGFSGPQWAFPYSANSFYNPFGVQINQVGYRTANIGPRTNFQNYDTYGITTGLEGSFDFADRFFGWDAFFSRSESSRDSTGSNFINLASLRNGIGPSFQDGPGGPIVCGTPDNPATTTVNERNVIRGCVPVNLFNGQTGLTQQMQDYITSNLVQSEELGLNNVGANLTGEIVQLPGGMMAFAAGLEYRKNSFTDTPDPLISSGNSSTNFREASSGVVTVEEAYLELSVPLLADLPFAERLELTLAGRTSDYEVAGLIGQNVVNREFDADTYKVGFAWKPYADLLVRGNKADTFRAPSVTDLFQGGQEGFPAAIDPCTFEFGNPYAGLTPEQQARCTAVGVPAGGAQQGGSTQVRGLFGGNPNLGPESGDTTTLGLVYSPSFVEGLDLSLDWWKIFLDDAVSSRSAQSILNGCIRTGDPTDCSFIERAAAPPGRVDTVRIGSFNLATLEVEGYDFTANYRFSTDMGDFGISSQNSYTSKSRQAIGELSEARNLVGRAEGAFGSPTWRLRSNTNLSWTRGDLSLNWGMRYMSSLNEDCSGLEGFLDAGLSTIQLCSDPDRETENESSRNRLGAVTYHDLSAALKTPWNATVRMGARNAFDKDPPVSVTAFANSFLQGYDIPGRYLWMSYTQQF